MAQKVLQKESKKGVATILILWKRYNALFANAVCIPACIFDQHVI